jgi:hypothetical protein
MSDTTQIATATADPDRDQDRRRSRRLADALRLRTKFLSLADLDGRTGAAKRVRDLIRQLETDIPDPSVMQRQLITRCALTSVMVEDVEARYLRGHAIDPLIHVTLSNSLRRLLTTLGLERRMRDTQTLDTYLASKREAKQAVIVRGEALELAVADGNPDRDEQDETP